MNVSGVEQFTPGRLTLARERRGITQRELGEIASVTPRVVNLYETGKLSPSTETLQAIARALKFPVSFFQAPEVEPLTLEAASFRALSKATASLRNRAVAAGTLALEMHRVLSEKFELPAPNVPDLREQSPERASDTLRHVWGIGQRPISNVVHLLEANGIRVFSLSEDCEAIDAFSIWRDGTPFVFLNTRKTAERSIFDAAHELAHLALHRHGSPQGQDAELQADRFASSFLLPESAIRSAAPRFPTIASVLAMKSTWHASVAAIGYRLHQLQLMSDWHYRQFNIELSRRGKKNEPAPLPRETSAILRKALGMLSEDGIGLKEIATELHVYPSELRALVFGLHAVD